MAVTALKITDEEGEKKVLFMTVPRKEKGVDVDIFVANEEFEATGTPSMGICQMNEEIYHVNLRKEAAEKGQFVPEFSTNPEWNPQ